MIERNNKIKWNKITFEEKRKIYLCKSELTLFKWNEINYVKERVKKTFVWTSPCDSVRKVVEACLSSPFLSRELTLSDSSRSRQCFFFLLNLFQPFSPNSRCVRTAWNRINVQMNLPRSTSVYSLKSCLFFAKEVLTLTEKTLFPHCKYQEHR